ncbi:acetolactate synthase small subunit [Labilibacter marinus]|uniref:acetolactate synthase small subunit n=1 Tax=Labilibacter marinus TaxID=1477105 RepID=UPI00082B0933|nr:acetolactate synthase small subunit [Labilibacter marinus]
MQQEFTITIFSENHVGLLNQVTTAFTRRSINIESLNTSESALEGVHKFTIVVFTTREQMDKLVGQLEKKLDVLKVFVFTTDEIIHQELALYKVPTEALLNGNEIEGIVRTYGAQIMEVTPEYTVIQKTGHKAETQELFVKLDKYGVLQFVRSGRISITKLRTELLEKYLRELRTENKIRGIETY